jgi:hypothetical protein
MEVCSFIIKILKLFSAFNFSFLVHKNLGLNPQHWPRYQYLQQRADLTLFLPAQGSEVCQKAVSLLPASLLLAE